VVARSPVCKNGARRSSQRPDSRECGIIGTVRFLHETSDGTLWIGTIGHGLHTFTTIVLPNHSTECLPSNTLLNLFEDSEKNLWVGTQGGMVRLSKTPVRPSALPDAADSDAERLPGQQWRSLGAAVNLFRYRYGKATPYQFRASRG